MITDLITVISLVFIVVGLVSATRFVWVYGHPPFEWREYEAGRHLMRFTVGIAAILAYSLVAFTLFIWFEETDWYEFTVAVGRLLIFGYVSRMMYSRLKLLLRSRAEGTPRRKEP